MPHRRHDARSQPLSCDNRELRQSSAADCTSITLELKSRAGRSELSLALSPLWVSNVVILVPRGVTPPYVTKTRDSPPEMVEGLMGLARPKFAPYIIARAKDLSAPQRLPGHISPLRALPCPPSSAF